MNSKFLFSIFALLFSLFLFQGCSSNLLEGKSPKTPDGANPNIPEEIPPVLTSCPTNFIPVPSKNGDSSILFCIAKYEMKNVDGRAVSQPQGTPWVNIDRDSSIAACSSMGKGFSLITNDQWWTVGRDLLGVPFNWINNVVIANDTHGISHGHSDGEPSDPLVASLDDSETCFGTGETCSQSEWSDQRRIFKLSNDSVLWDFAGNVFEWVADKEISLTEEQGAFTHGGCLVSGQSADIMTIYKPVGSSSDIQLPDEHSAFIGFRCTYK